MTALWFVLAAAGGALARHGVNRLGHAWIGTVAVNGLGSFVLGLVAGGAVDGDARVVIGTAACGSLTTFSMFALEVVEARDATRIRIVSITIAVTVAAAAVGHQSARLLVGG
jgi:CrcB protein